MRTVKPITALFACLFFISLAGYGFAETTDDVALLKKEITVLKSRINQLEQRLSDAQNATAYTPTTTNDAEDLLDPFSTMKDIERQMNSFMAQQSGGFPPPMPSGMGAIHPGSFNPGYDIKGTEKSYVITFDMPGMDKSKINVEINNGILLVSGERSGETESNDKDSHIYRQERSFGYFSRSIPLPKDAKPDGIQAKYENGILTVIIEKKESSPKKENTAKKINVK